MPKSLIPEGFVPEAPNPASIYYWQKHPTRYEWRPDVEHTVRTVYTKFPNVHINTYFDHPENWNRDSTSFDVWGEDGRDYPLPSGLGWQVFEFLFNHPTSPLIEWIIWEGRIWIIGQGWKPYVDTGATGTGLHFDHIHVTYLSGPKSTAGTNGHFWNSPRMGDIPRP